MKPRKPIILSGICITALIAVAYFFSQSERDDEIKPNPLKAKPIDKEQLWVGPARTEIDSLTEEGKLIAYGRDLIANTAHYLGPKGVVMQTTNGMNCQNCHLDAGTKPWGNNYGGVYTTYPRFRARSGSVEDIYKRVNDCLERSLNGKILDTTGREMQAIKAYMEWLGKDLPKGKAPAGSGLMEIPLIERPADSLKGLQVYTSQCERCHGKDGQGQFNPDGKTYLYPPLWGKHSYTTGAGLFRLSRLAGYAYNNMPFGTTYENPILTVEEAWDVAAFINSQPHPVKVFKQDWPDISKKPFDHPFGPYADSFPESQHKYGPFLAIKKFKETSRSN
ncbi:MAG TPA: c-type cytochrome [Cyclobacteriaceae bacterium]|nr:c-type cytochrome [Cyclobacteriaceae bacterium]